MMTRNTIILIGFCLAALVVSIKCHKRQNIYKQLEQQCQQKSDISNQQLEEYRNNDYDKMDQKLKCYIHCLMERMGYFQSSRHLNVQRIVQYEELDPSYENFINECTGKYNAVEDPCDYGFNIMTCIRKMKNDNNLFHAPKYYN